MKGFGLNKVIILILLVLVVLGAKYWSGRKDTLPAEQALVEEQTEKVEVISISEKNIKEENFSGSEPVFSGSGLLVTSARAYVESVVGEFRKEANTDVPDMRAKFGTDSPTANYTIDIEAKEVESDKTNSIILSMYTYTGGANGNSSYKTFTISRSSQKILALSQVIKKEKETAFTDLVKKKLIAWRPEGTDEPVVFPDAVGELTFSSFTNWSLDDKNLNIYFNKYDVGPGVLGAIVFPIPRTEINSFFYVL